MKKKFMFFLMLLLFSSGYSNAQTGCDEIPPYLVQVSPSDFTNNIYTVDFARTLTLTAGADTTGIDPNDIIYQWDFANGAVLYGETINYSFVQEGLVTLTLSTIYQGCTTSVTFTFNVQKGVSFSLYKQFNGKYDYMAIGNTLNLQENVGILVSDDCGILTESSAALSLQPSQSIVAAYLYWSGSGLGDFDVKLNNIDVTAQRTFYSTITLGANNHKPFFGAFADVTNIVTSSGTYTLSDFDITATLANDLDYCYSAVNYGGWSVIIVYNDSTLPYNQVSIYDGFKTMDQQNPLLNIYLDNLNVISNVGAKIGFLAWEGDAAIAVNEAVKVNGFTLSNPPLNPANNAFNGTNSFTGASDLWNMDIDFYNIQNYINVGDTDLDVSLTTGQDGVIMNNIVTVVNSELPDASIEMIFYTGNEICGNRDLQLVYIAKNYNSTDILPANTPISVYANDILIGSTFTTIDIAIESSETNSISVSLPPEIPTDFVLKMVIDDSGDGTGVVRETDESNNDYIENITLRVGIEPQTVNSLYSCSSGTTGLFDLTQATISVEDYEYDFYTTQEDAEMETGAIADFENFISGNTTLYVRIYDILSPSCYSIEPFSLTVLHCQPNKPEDILVCAETGENTKQINLTDLEAEIREGTDPDENTVTFHNTLQGAQDGNDLVSEPEAFTVTAGSEVTVYIRMENTQNPALFGTTSFTITVTVPPVVSAATPLERCADNSDEQTYFDLTVAGAEILNGQTGLTITYHETPEGAEFGTNEIQNPSNYDNLVSPVYASVIQSGTTTNCRSVVPIELIVHPRPAVPVLSDYVLCDDDTDGVQVFDLTTKNTEANGGDTSLTVAYYITKEDALAGQAPISPDTAFSNTVAGTQQIWVGIATTFGCRSVAPLTLRVNPLPVLSNDSNAYIANECEEVPGQAEFHLEEIAAAITDGAPGYSVVFYLTPEQAEFGGTDYLPTPYLSGDTTLYPRITDDITGCYTTGVTVDLNVIPAPIATPPAPIEECDFNNDGFAQFDMTGAMAAIEAALGNVEVTAYETPEDAEHDVNPIPNPDNYTNINQHGQTIYLRVQSTLTDCYDLVTLQLIVNPVPEATEPSDYALCDDGASDTDGIATFDLTIKAAEILGSLDPAQYSISYHVNLTDAQNGTPSITNAASYPSGTATIYVRVTNNTTGCYDIVTLELIVNPLPELITNQSVYTLCDTTAPMDKEVFDLTSRIPDFIADASGMTITFHHSFADAQGDTNPISEADALAYENQVPQVETLFVRFEVTATGCYRIGFLDLRVEHQPIILEPTQDELTVCDTNGQGIGEFDLAALEESMANGDPDLAITFHETAEDAIAGINPIPTTENYVNAVPYIQDIYVRVTDTRIGCSNTVPYVLTLIVSPAPQAPSLEDLTFCDDADNNGQDGKRRVDLTVQNAVIADALGLTIPDDLIVEYYTTVTGANSGLANRITNPATYMGSDQQVIWVRVEDPVTGCYSVESFMLIFNAPHALTTPSPLAICNEALPNDGQAEFDLTVREDQLLGPSGIGQGYTVEYYESDPRVDTGAIAIADPEHYTNPAPPAGNPKTLFVKVTTQDGCVSYTTLTIKVLPLPTPDTTPDALVLCDDNGDGDGVEEFDLTQAAADIKDNGSNYILTYYTTQEDAQNEVNPIADPSAYESGTGSVWVRVALDTHNPAEPMCAQIVELPLIVNPLPPVADLEPFAHCEQNTDGAYDFNIQEYVNNALGGNEADEYDVDFFEDAALTTPAVPVTAYPVTGGSGTVYVRVTNNDTGCMIVKELSLLVEEGAIANPITTVFDECDYDGANDGIISTWDLTAVEGEVLGTQDPAGYEVTYYTSLEDAENYENAIATPEAYTNTIADDQTIWVRVTNTATLSKCHDITTFTLHVERLAEPVITGENGSNTVCIDVDGTTDGLLLDSGVVPAGHSYRWFLDGVELTDADPSSGTYLAVSEGDYTVEVTGPLPNACVSDLSAVFTVIKSGMASPVGAGYYVTNYFSDNQVITITVEGNGEYVYQLDEGPTQTSPVFTNVSPGPHMVRVYDVKTEFSCGVLPIEGVSVVDYPNFFTPNGDGFHDTWNIIGLQNTGSVIYIFDRYGKLIKQISPDLESDGWDGTFNGTPLPADDYWFSVTYPEFDGTTTVTREFKAHFSLKR